MQVYHIPIDPSGRETTCHGDPGFPVAAYETVLAKNVLGFVDWHWHEELQFCLVTEGSVRFLGANVQTDTQKHQGVFIGSGVPHMARPLTEDAAYFCVDVHPALLSGPPGSILGPRYIAPLRAGRGGGLLPLRGKESWEARALEILAEVESLFDRPPCGFELAVTGQLLLVLQLITAGAKMSPTGVPEGSFSRMKSVLRFLNDHYREKITLTQLAGLVNLCPSEFCRAFKRATGCTAFDYLCNLRVSKSASALIEHPEYTVSYIACEYGFSTVSAYIEQFRSRTGLTPGKYREKALAGKI